MTEKKTIFAFRIPILMAALIIPVLSIGINQSYSEETFVYVSNGEDGDIAVMKLDPETGDMKTSGKGSCWTQCNAYGIESRSSIPLCIYSFRTFFSGYLFHQS